MKFSSLVCHNSYHFFSICLSLLSSAVCIWIKFPWKSHISYSYLLLFTRWSSRHLYVTTVPIWSFSSYFISVYFSLVPWDNYISCYSGFMSLCQIFQKSRHWYDTTVPIHFSLVFHFLFQLCSCFPNTLGNVIHLFILVFCSFVS